MKKWNKVYKRNEDIVSRQIDDEMILMPIYKTNKDINEMYTLNETAAEMWNSIDGEITVRGIIKKMSGKHSCYHADYRECIRS